MRIFSIIFMIWFLFVACQQKEETSEETQQETVSENTLLQKVDPAGTYGAGITLAEKISISEILAEPAKFEGKRVLVEGTVVDVCKKRGCWIDISGGEEFETIKVKVKDGEIVFPLSAKGNKALVEGFVEKLELTKEQTINWKAHEAEEMGIPFDSSSVTEPMIIWRIKGTGAEI